ncbi:MAG: hypothetical protein HN463_16955 [Gemmatimonadales bacterium]|jgi:hypothetical protein|nr:hypothetical protein [Gemmatimonadales bacterium]
MAAMPVRASSRREGHNYIHLLNAWFEGSLRKKLTLAGRDIFRALLHVTNAKYFPESIDVYEADLAEFTDVHPRTVKRALADLMANGLIHFGTIDDSSSRKNAVRIRIQYDVLEWKGTRPDAEFEEVKSASGRLSAPKPQSSCGSKPTQVQHSRTTPDCPKRTTVVSEVGHRIREGSPCPKCQKHPLETRFRTNAATRTKDRFLACSGYRSGDCAGFTWNLSSSAYKPSQRVLLQALVGAQDVPGRPRLVRDVLAAQRVEEASETVIDRVPEDLSSWFLTSRYLPVELMLESLSVVDSELASRHRLEGTPKHAIVQDVRTRLGTVE